MVFLIERNQRDSRERPFLKIKWASPFLFGKPSRFSLALIRWNSAKVDFNQVRRLPRRDTLLQPGPGHRKGCSKRFMALRE